MAALRYNSHTRQFTHLEYTIQWFLLFMELCSHSSILHFYHSPKKHIPLPSPSKHESPVLANTDLSLWRSASSEHLIEIESDDMGASLAAQLGKNPPAMRET